MVGFLLTMEAGKQSMDGCAAACHVAYALRCGTVPCCCEFGRCILFVILVLMSARLLLVLYSLVVCVCKKGNLICD